MLQIRSIAKVADNTGAKFVRVFTILGGSRKRYARIGEVVNASVQSAEPRKAIKKKDKVKELKEKMQNIDFTELKMRNSSKKKKDKLILS